jgi:hypothetical protein
MADIVQESPQSTLQSLEAELTARQAAAAAHTASAPAATDLAAVEQHRVEAQRLNSLVADASAAVDYQRGVVERAEAAAAEKAAKARHAAAQKSAKDHERLVRQIEMRARMLAADLARLETHRADIASLNAELGKRFGHIQDAEERVRRQPARTVPPSYRDETIWVDAQGDQAFYMRTTRDFRTVSRDGSPLHQITRQVVQTPERFVPASMPPRLSETVVLPTLDGKGTIWPPRR